jgi:lipopolysaccharide export system protein LptA
MKYLAGLLLSSTLLFGASEQLIIDAKNFEASDKEGVSTFSGNVKIQMGKDKLNAEKVSIFFNTNGKNPTKYEATGNVNFEFNTKTKKYIGKGNKVVYSPLKEEYTIIGNGFLQEKNDNRKIYGEKIYVNQLSGEAKVSGSDNKPVRFIIDVKRGEGN